MRPDCLLQITNPSATARQGEPVTAGVPFPRGWCTDPTRIRIAGGDTPLQTRALERWSDGSLRWVLVDLLADVPAWSTRKYLLERAALSRAAAPSSILVSRQDSQLTFEAGAVSLVLGGGHGPWLALQHEGRTTVGELFVRQGSNRLAVTSDRIQIEEEGPVRAAAQLHGRVGDVLAYWLRVEAFASTPAFRLQLVLHNPQRAEHPGNFWELGDRGSVLVDEAAVRLLPPSPGLTSVRCSPDRETPLETMTMPLVLWQESSGGEAWQSHTHIDRSGHVPFRFRGYRLETADEERTGQRATPLVHARAGTLELAVTSEQFWELFPKSYAVGESAIEVGLLPQATVPHELQGGERFNYRFTVACGHDAVSEPALDWVRAPLQALVSPEWMAHAQAVPHLLPRVELPSPTYDALVDVAIDGSSSFASKREIADEFGWRHFGDLYADHENGRDPETPRRVSHYNNQYDALAGMLVQGWRTGDFRWRTLADQLAAHVAHIDIYWTEQDRSAYNGGLFWHTAHYTDAGRSSHRSYPKAPGIHGGGPSAEHNYSTGLTLHHLATGDPLSREAVLRLARWTVDMDDGSKTPLRWIAPGPTGTGSATGSTSYHGPGRGPANGIQTLLNALQLTGDAGWLDAAEQLIRRCIHPHDDVPARNLLDAERRWYYTVFLQALGRYLGVKDERNEHDLNWHYARASLLRYARWMAEHEYPYLEKPEILEFPTETWAAQDMRKSEVFDLAFMYAANGAERERFAERARFFFASSTHTLASMPTHVWTRPTVLMTVCGYGHLWFERHRAELPLHGPVDEQGFGTPPIFVPQTARAVRRVAGLAAAGALASVALVVWWLRG